MHHYYAENKEKFRKGMNKFMLLVSPELEKISGENYAKILEEIWDYYEKNLLENFPYIRGDKVSGTKSLTGAYCFIAMGEVLKHYGSDMDGIVQPGCGQETTYYRDDENGMTAMRKKHMKAAGRGQHRCRILLSVSSNMSYLPGEALSQVTRLLCLYHFSGMTGTSMSFL